MSGFLARSLAWHILKGSFSQNFLAKFTNTDSPFGNLSSIHPVHCFPARGTSTSLEDGFSQHKRGWLPHVPPSWAAARWVPVLPAWHLSQLVCHPVMTAAPSSQGLDLNSRLRVGRHWGYSDLLFPEYSCFHSRCKGCPVFCPCIL